MASTPSADKPLRVAVIGLGWAGVTHVENYAAIPDVRVVAIASQERDKMADVARRFDVPAEFSSWEDLVEGSDIDALSICTPNYLHHPICLSALRAGIHVLCEKPLALDSRQASEMVQEAEKADRVLRTVFNFRHRGDVQILRESVASGVLGKVYYAKASWMRRNHFQEVPAWNAHKETAGGGPLIDLGVHMLDLVLYSLGEPDVVRASGVTYNDLASAWIEAHGGSPGSWEVEDLGSGLLRLADGSSILLEASWALNGPVANDEMRIELYGSRGGADLLIRNFAESNTLRFFVNFLGAPAEVVPELPAGHGHAGVIHDFVDTIRSGDWSAQHGNEGLVRSRILDALYFSASHGHEVAVADFPAAVGAATTPVERAQVD